MRVSTLSMVPLTSTMSWYIDNRNLAKLQITVKNDFLQHTINKFVLCAPILYKLHYTANNQL